METTKTVLIVEDHKSTSLGLEVYINEQPDLTVVGNVSSAEEALNITREQLPDCILLDLLLPDRSGMEIIPELMILSSETKILIYTAKREVDVVLESYRLGACGFISKSTFGKSLIRAIYGVLTGNFYMDSFFVKLILDKMVQEEITERLLPLGESLNLDLLTTREKVVFQAIGESKSIKEIAETLFISKKTVANHRSNIMKKLDMNDSKELFKSAFKEQQRLKIDY